MTVRSLEKYGLVLDVETTGLGPTKDEVIELALKLFTYRSDSGEIIDIVEEDSFLREPLSDTARYNYDQAYRVHGIPYELVRGKSFYDAKIKTYFHRANTVFAHNASFDRSFLYHMYPEVNDLKWYCTMRGVPWKNYGYPNGKLLTLLQAHNITNYQTHRALDDITYLMELLKKTSPNGNLYLQEVLEKGPMRKYQPATARTKMG
ncbi:exonuclease domain-containing protein [Neobacillus sp. OS1-2]|uniref:exonuclease domain-containing protein n=1 Tax=Neobacillus sp. OS1-2 TaxID=3070680 RepID=UPI0027E0C686|nr:exonuclease domain-containing protein [Neobacillus sp. OS1-2]WML42308.1 exonuclease domain-containing protein [Neobacillus sp. OS1-2]